MREIHPAVATLLLALGECIYASEFDGAYVGASVGRNRADLDSNPAKNSNYLGLKAGYNRELGDFLLGGELFVKNHSRSYTGPDSGAVVRFGLPTGQWLPYAKVGVVGNDSGRGYRPHGGIGLAYVLGERWSVDVDWTIDKKEISGATYRNIDITIGLNFSLDAVPTSSAASIAALSACSADGPADNAATESAAAATRAEGRTADAETAPSADFKMPARHIHKIFF